MPLLAWFVAGSIKFLINLIRFGTEARSRIGYGGLPSTHTTIISTAVFLCGFNEGFEMPLFGLGLAVLLIVIIDAHGLRRQIGKHAVELNTIHGEKLFRESMGHSWFEIGCGVALGSLLAYLSTVMF